MNRVDEIFSRLGMVNNEYRKAAGERSGRTLLWIHGLGESSLCFRNIVRHPSLAGMNHLYPDMPGYGKAPWPEHPLSFAKLVDNLACYLELLIQDPVVVVGHSLGGVLGLLLAERRPDLVNALVDVDGNKTAEDCVYSGRASDMESEMFFSNIFPAMLDDIYREGISDPALRGYYTSLCLCDVRTFHQHSIELFELSRKRHLAKRLATLDMSKLYIGGSPGGVSTCSLEMLKAVEVPMSMVKPSGHWPFIDQPDDFAEILKGFISS